MIGWLLLVVAGLAICFGGVLLVGAPYLPTMKPQIGAALDLLELEAGQTMLELGCGDGRVLVAAARRGWHCVGYELNPLLAVLAWLVTRRYGRRVRVVWGDYWRADWPPAAGIFAFILPRYMTKLDKKIAQESRNPVKLVSFAFRIPERSPAAERAGVFLYRYE